jgi:hypothetical protein
MDKKRLGRLLETWAEETDISLEGAAWTIKSEVRERGAGPDRGGAAAAAAAAKVIVGRTTECGGSGGAVSAILTGCGRWAGLAARLGIAVQ